MRGEAKERGVVKNSKWSEGEIKKSWTDIIPEEMWEDVSKKLNLASEYEKGTQTANRHITYQAYLNKTVEEIRLNSQRRYRTDSEIFRVSVHLGMNLLYNIFCRKSKMLKKSRTRFFYEALQEVERNMERATMLSIMQEKNTEFTKKISKGKMTLEDAAIEMKRFWDNVPPEDLDFIKKGMSRENTDNVKNIGNDLVKKFVDN